MIRWPSGFQRGLALVLVGAGVLGSLAWFWHAGSSRQEIGFLPQRAPAEWIVYPSPPDGMPHLRVKLETVFRSSFTLEKPPARATVRLAGYHAYRGTLNGTPFGAPLQRGRNWKEPDEFEVTRQLRAGENQIEVMVANTTGPPALWFVLEADGQTLVSGEKWTASLAGAAWRPAALAKRPQPLLPGSPLAGGESVGEALGTAGPKLFVLMLLSAAGYWAFRRWRLSDGWLAAALALAWVALLANNLGPLPEICGFDAPGHEDYIRYLQKHQSLPLANEGWEMFQPPLYYLVAAGLLKLLGLSIAEPAGLFAVRLLGLAIGISSFLLVRASLRLLFPKESAKAAWGLALAGCLPPVLYLAHYISNEAFAAACISAVVYLTLRLLQQEQMPWKACLGLGLALGLALLAKSTALLMLPVTFGALLWRWLEKRQLSFGQWAERAVVIGAVCVGVCGWHYFRAWQHFGNPFIGVWDPKTGFGWWQDYGYHTAGFYTRFGEALRHPWFSAFSSFGDGLYSTLWGDGLLGGSAFLLYRPPWNFDLMAVGYWLALIPSLALLVGAGLAVRQFLRQPSAEWFLLLGLGFLAAMALVQMSLALPYYCTVKAFYGLCALIPFCVVGALGLDWLVRLNSKLRALLCVLVGLWALNSFASLWVVRSSLSNLTAQALALHASGRSQDAARVLKAHLRAAPQDVEIRSLLALVLSEWGVVEEAGQHAEIVLEINPNDAMSHFVLASSLCAQQRWAEADAHAHRALELAPGLSRAYEVVAKAASNRGLTEPAMQAAREGLGVAPFNVQLRTLLGSMLAARGENAEAIAQLQLAAALDPRRTEASRQLTALLAAQGQLSAPSSPK